MIRLAIHPSVALCGSEMTDPTNGLMRRSARNPNNKQRASTLEASTPLSPQPLPEHHCPLAPCPGRNSQCVQAPTPLDTTTTPDHRKSARVGGRVQICTERRGSRPKPQTARNDSVDRALGISSHHKRVRYPFTPSASDWRHLNDYDQNRSVLRS